MLGLKEQIFGSKGYSTDLKLNIEELNTFRHHVNHHWLYNISHFYPDLADQAKHLGIENYHLLANLVDHQKLWPKSNRILPSTSVEHIKKLPFLATLREEFGEFDISDVYDTEQHYGHEEIYWRLVRPNEKGDVGSLHKDTWFHGAFNGGYGMFPPGTVTVKIWVPIYCEAGKNGLAISKGSHLKKYQYRMIIENNAPRPYLEEDPATVGAELIYTEPGNLLVFNEEVLHGGVINTGTRTRVSAEITMVLKNNINT